MREAKLLSLGTTSHLIASFQQKTSSTSPSMGKIEIYEQGKKIETGDPNPILHVAENHSRSL